VGGEKGVCGAGKSSRALALTLPDLSVLTIVLSKKKEKVSDSGRQMAASDVLHFAASASWTLNRLVNSFYVEYVRALHFHREATWRAEKKGAEIQSNRKTDVSLIC